MITEVEEPDKLPAGPCSGCGNTFEGALLDDDGLCLACEGWAYGLSVIAEDDSEEIKEAWRVWDKVSAEAMVLKLAEDDLWVAEQWQKLPEWERQEAERFFKHPEETDPWEALNARERTVKDRELTRRERRQDGYDTDDASSAEPTAVLTFADFGREVTLLDAERMPSAFERCDGETILYEGVANILFGEPSSCKSFVALMMAIQRLRAGRRVIWWDNEDRATTVARRLQLLRATDLIGCPELAFRTGDMQDSQTAMFEALDFLARGTGPGMVVVDSATAFGCPKDGADVAPWMKTHIKPWINEGHSTTQLDHVPKQRKDRPMGAVGSFEKLSDIRGAALYIHGKGWNQQQGGAVHLTVHKDAGGQLPAIKDSVVSTVSAQWDGPTLAYTIGLPNAKSESEDLEMELMEAFGQVTDGVRGSRGVRRLLKGKRARDVDKARDELLQAGMIQREKVGHAYLYTVIADGEEEQ